MRLYNAEPSSKSNTWLEKRSIHLTSFNKNNLVNSNIICTFAPSNNKNKVLWIKDLLTLSEAVRLYRETLLKWRSIQGCRYTFVDLCEKLNTNRIDLPDFHRNIAYAEIGIWMHDPYMKLYDKNGKDLILYQFSNNTIKTIYLYLKGKLMGI